MNNILLDTCVWIDLAGTPPLHPLLMELSALCKSSGNRLVLPDSVVIEFSRNRQRTAEAWIKSIQGHIRGLSFLNKAVAGISAEVSTIETTGQQAIIHSTTEIQVSLKEVDDLFAQAIKWSPNASHTADVCRRCVELRAPAVKKNRSSVGDCLIWSSILDLLDNDSVWFCTSNNTDFSDDIRKDILHPDLVVEASSKAHKLYYFNDPTKLVRDLRAAMQSKPAVTVALPNYFDFVDQAPQKCPGCGHANFTSGSYLRSRYGGLTRQYVCLDCGYHHDTGDFFD